ncbi:MAG: putative tryptophan/tyrosine transport system substrate-binding protein [Candidatus Atribacteria bacterium]|nr:putative tryptophan/tyrosine transport system substrate-binding protein [Candidatus Atribacteria bacterium]
MKRKIFLLVLVGLLLGTFSAFGQELTTIGIMQIVDHPALNATRDGIIDALAEEYGYLEGENIRYDAQSAQGDVATANTIARKFVTEKVDVIVAIATPAAQAAVNATQDIPVVFSAVTDPVSAGLVKSLEKPGGNVTGVSDMTPVEEQMKLIKFLFPQADRLGTIYNAGEVNSVVTNDLAKEACQELGMELLESTVATTADVVMATQSLASKVDAIYVSTDNTVVSALDGVARVCREKKIPLILADPTTVQKGAFCALGFDYYLHGRQTADIIVAILEGENPGEIPVQFAQKLVLLVNREVAEALGLDLEALEDQLEEFVQLKKEEGIEVSLQFE